MAGGLHSPLELCLWANHITSLGFNFLIQKEKKKNGKISILQSYCKNCEGMIHTKNVHVRAQPQKMRTFPQVENWRRKATSEMERTQASKVQRIKCMVSSWSRKGNQGPYLEGHKVARTTLLHSPFGYFSPFSVHVPLPRDSQTHSWVFLGPSGLSCARNSNSPMSS